MGDSDESERIWKVALRDGSRYLESLQKQVTAVSLKDLGFRKFDHEIKIAQRHFAMAKAGISNYHRHRRTQAESRE